MLIRTMKTDDVVSFAGCSVMILGVQGGRVKVGIEAPQNVHIHTPRAEPKTKHSTYAYGDTSGFGEPLDQPSTECGCPGGKFGHYVWCKNDPANVK